MKWCNIKNSFSIVDISIIFDYSLGAIRIWHEQKISISPSRNAYNNKNLLL